MEGLAANAKTVYEEAVKQKTKQLEEEYKRQISMVGLNPFMGESQMLRDAISFLEKKVMETASNASNSVIIPYKNIPGVADRIKVVEPYPLVAQRDLSLSIRLIQDEFRRVHPDFVSKSHNDPEIVIHGFHSLKLTF